MPDSSASIDRPSAPGGGRSTPARRLCSSSPADALQHAKRTGAAFVILDGLIHIDRNQIDRPFYSGKHKRHGMNLQAIADVRGNLLWISGAIRGSIHDTAAARIWRIPRLLAEHGRFALGGKGYDGLDHDLVITPDQGQAQWQKEYNRRLHARLRGPGEREPHLLAPPLPRRGPPELTGSFPTGCT